MAIGVSEHFMAESGVLRVRVTEGLELDGGAWQHTGEEKGWLIATVTPPTVPMFQQVVAYLVHGAIVATYYGTFGSGRGQRSLLRRRIRGQRR